MKNEKIHESSILHTTGKAIYIDDIAEMPELLHARVYTSKVAAGKIISYDIEKARAVDGVHVVLCYKDIPGENQMGPVVKDEPILAIDKVEFVGQAIFILAAKTEEIADYALSLIKIDIKEEKPILTIEEAIIKGNLLHPERKIECGSIDKAFYESKNTIKGSLRTGAQEHWYLETQISLVVPGEGKELKVYCSTQHPSETQELVAEAIGVSKHEVEVEVRRMGGAFGGKETQANHIAIWAALLSNATHKPVKLRLYRDEDQIMTGKRHPFLINYKAAFNNDGLLSAVDIELNTNAGYASDVTMPILERALFHADNAYFIPNMRIIGKAWRTNTASNTAFRGFGAPQAMAAIETIIDRIARVLKMDAVEIRHKNFYGTTENNITPYGQIVENNRLEVIWKTLSQSSEYFSRRKAVNEFNKENEYIKRGLAASPVKFGISFTTAFLNQAGALVNIYKDGSVLVNHGGIEMGQGLHTKMQQIASEELGVSFKNIKVSATSTAKVPNTSATAASSGADMNGMAVKDAVAKLKKRIGGVVADYFREHFSSHCKNEEIVFQDDKVFDETNHENSILFKDAVLKTYLERVSLSATGFYRTPGIYYNIEKGKGNPFYYYAFGMAVSEVEIDLFTGQHKILRTDILHDAGKSINEALDIGQVEGGFIQGVGWCTTEECKWDKKGNLLNHSPDTYKIPTINDIPEDFRVELLQGYPNPNTIRQSKAVGEPPFMLALSVWLAIKDAISAKSNHLIEPEFEIPATHEKIIMALDKMKN